MKSLLSKYTRLFFANLLKIINDNMRGKDSKDMIAINCGVISIIATNAANPYITDIMVLHLFSIERRSQNVVANKISI
jgi:hypothetical protein